MAMEFLTSYDSFVVDLSADEQHDDFFCFDVDIIQHPQVTGTQFKIDQWIGP